MTQWPPYDPQQPPPPGGGYQPWAGAYPAAAPVAGYHLPHFDPADPLISPDYAGWFGRSVAVLRAAWRPLLVLNAIAAAFGLALLAPLSVFSLRWEREFERGVDSPGGPDWGLLGGGLALTLAVTAVVLLVSMLILLAEIRVVTAVAAGGRPRIGAELAAALRRLPALLGWGIVAALICTLAVLACFLPIIYAAAVLLVLPAVLVFERGNAIVRCFQLFHAEFGSAAARAATVLGAAFGISVLVAVLSAVIGGAIAGPQDMTGPVTDRAVAGALISSVLEQAAALVLGVVLTPFLVTMYADLRARYEPLTTGTLTAELQRR